MQLSHSGTVILCDGSDVNNLDRNSLVGRKVISLLPEAFAAAKSLNAEILRTSEVYTDCDHARCVAFHKQLEHELTEVLRSEGLRYSTAGHVIRIGLTKTILGVWALRRIISKTSSPWFICYKNEWNGYRDIHEAVRILTHRLIPLTDGDGLKKTPANYWLRFYEYLEPAILKAIGNAPRIIVRKWPKPNPRSFMVIDTLIVAINKHKGDAKLLGIQPLSSDALGPVSLVRVIRGAVSRSDYCSVPIPLSADEGVRSKAGQVLEYLQSTILKSYLTDSWKKYLVNRAVYFQALADRLGLVLDQMKIAAYITDDLHEDLATAIGEACHRSNIPCVLVSHSSHTDQLRAIPKWECQQFASLGQIISPFVDELLCRTPGVARQLKTLKSDNWFNKSINAQPYRSFPSVSVSQSRAVVKRPVILHAGNFFGWDYHKPWILLTSDEYVDSLISLCSIMERLSDVDLVIRLKKTKGGIDLATLKSFLPDLPNVKIKTDGTFQEDLSNSDLLIADRSSTIDEALHVRKPVLLWSTSGRYNHYCYGFNNGESCRNVIYRASSHSRDVDKLIRKILTLHRGKPLTDEELQNYVWPESVSSMDHVVEKYCKQL